MTIQRMIASGSKCSLCVLGTWERQAIIAGGYRWFVFPFRMASRRTQFIDLGVNETIMSAMYSMLCDMPLNVDHVVRGRIDVRTKYFVYPGKGFYYLSKIHSALLWMVWSSATGKRESSSVLA
ncbi:hypothetical protein KI387_040876, partial [Taxus chinensis]